MVYDVTLCYNAPATTIGNHTFIFKGASISNNWAKINIDGTVQQISGNTWYNVDSTLKIKVTNLNSGGCENYGYSGIVISVDDGSGGGTYYKCENGACNQKQGVGTSDCTPGQSCGGGGTYYRCENNSCNQKQGVGTSDCTPGQSCGGGIGGGTSCEEGKIKIGDSCYPTIYIIGALALLMFMMSKRR